MVLEHEASARSPTSGSRPAPSSSGCSTTSSRPSEAGCRPNPRLGPRRCRQVRRRHDTGRPLSRLLSGSAPVIPTSARARTADAPAFVYVDARRADSRFGLLHAVLDGVVGLRPTARGAMLDGVVGSVSDRGLVELCSTASSAFGRLLVEPCSTASSARQPRGTFGAVGDATACVTVGRTPPELNDDVRPPARVPTHERHVLADLLTARASDGLA